MVEERPSDVSVGSTLQAGNIYIADYEVLEGITPNSTDPCTMQYLAAPICLLYRTVGSKILPLAIQVPCGRARDEQQHHIYEPGLLIKHMLLSKATPQ